jgi:uncharacterized protein (DUF1810 family)
MFGFPDVLKHRSSMALFGKVAGGDNIFSEILEKYYDGHRDVKTLELIEDEHHY